MATKHRSALALIPLEKLFSGRDDILIYREKASSSVQPSNDPFEHVLENPLVISFRRHPRAQDPRWKIPPSEWSAVLRRVDQGEALRSIAKEYHVSYEAVRRVVRAARQQEG